MAVYKEGYLLVMARGFAFVFAAAALLVYTHQPAEGEFHATALALLSLDLCCLVTACFVILPAQVTRLVKGRALMPSNLLLWLSLMLLDYALVCFTVGSASATVAVTDWAMRAGMLVQPRLGRIFWHGVLACAAGASTSLAFVSSFFVAFGPPPAQQLLG